MRLWSIHPQHLDTKGLSALWREGLLAKAVLEGKTKGYRNHPQLLRFKHQSKPLQTLNYYLSIVQVEATNRGFTFDLTKIRVTKRPQAYPLTQGQFQYEKTHLQKKLAIRSPEKYLSNKKLRWHPHPLFTLVEGSIEDWEKV